MTRPAGNTRLKAARQHAGYASQQDFANALTRAANALGLGHIEVSARQVRRWESTSPPWPRADHQRLITHVLQMPIEQLGFTPPWDTPTADAIPQGTPAVPPQLPTGATLPLPTATASVQPDTVGADYAAITVAYAVCTGAFSPHSSTPPSPSTPGLATSCSPRPPGSPAGSWPPPSQNRCS